MRYGLKKKMLKLTDILNITEIHSHALVVRAGVVVTV